MLSSSETESPQLLHAPSCCLLLSLSSLQKLSPPAAPSPSLSLCLCMSLAPSSHTGSSVGGEQREGGASAHRLSFCMTPPPPPFPLLCKALPWRLCWRFFFFLNLTLSSVYFGFSGTLQQFSPRFSLFFLFLSCLFLSSVNPRAAGWGHRTPAILRNSVRFQVFHRI